VTRPLHSARCLCGLRAVLHFTRPHCSGRKLTCHEARVRHPYARATAGPFINILRREAAIGARERVAS
jgi:hypothetical protein